MRKAWGAQPAVTTKRDRRYASPAWRALRRQVLVRDKYECQLRLPKCTGTASEVDHKAPPSMGGSFFDAWNLRAACKSCNIARRNKMRAQVARKALGEEL